MDLNFYNPSKALLYIKEIERGDVIFFDIHPNNFCNHNCIWCKFEHNKLELSYEDMVRHLDKYPTVRGVRISGGGEPLLNRDTFPFIDECVRRGVEVGLFTNGSLLNDDNIPTVSKCRFCRISLDAATPLTHHRIHGSKDFDIIIENINKLRRTNIRELGISFMVTEETVYDIPLLETLEVDVDYMHFKPINIGISDEAQRLAIEHLENLEQKIKTPLRYNRVLYDSWANKKIPCRISRIIRAIPSDNKTYSCCEHHYEPEYDVTTWNGDNSKCTNCVYNSYNEILDLYYTDKIAKGFF